MKLYKLTDQGMQTYGGCQWGENVTHTADGNGPLCSKYWLHAYTDPVLAILLNPIHGNVKNPILWECEGEIGISDNGLKVGCTKLTTLRQIPVPKITNEQKIAFAILCTKQVYKDEAWNTWADNWLSGKDRSEDAAAAAAADAAYAARAAESTTLDLIALAHEALKY